MPRTRKSKKRGGAPMSLLAPMIKKMVMDAQHSQGGKRRRRRGAGWLGDVWSGIKNVAGKVAGPVNDLLKSTKVISKFAPSLLPGVGSAIGTVAGLAGYGRKKRVVRKRGGYKVTGIAGPPMEVYGGYRKLGGASHSMRARGGYKFLMP